MDGETIELAKPVIGTSEPAPANFPILLKIFNPVRKALIPIKIIETIVPDIVINVNRKIHLYEIFPHYNAL